MRNIDNEMKMVEEKVEEVKVNVKMKMRIGWDEKRINEKEIERREEDEGIEMVKVNGRKRWKFYEGNEEWDEINEVRDEVRIKIVENGDV